MSFARVDDQESALPGVGEDGLQRQIRPCGEGAVDFRAILPILAEAKPDLTLSIENPTTRGGIGITEISDPVWAAAHPDLTVEEFAAWIRLVMTDLTVSSPVRLPRFSYAWRRSCR